MSRTIKTDRGTVKLVTNGHIREVVTAWALPAEVREEFDYLDWDAIEVGNDSASFVRYGREWYDLGNVEQAPPELWKAGFHAMISETYWSGVAFRYVYDWQGGKGVIVARFAYLD